jgi:alkylated DNA repair protein alkB family protein 8
LAGVIEKTRRHEFYIQGSNTSTDFPRVFDKINQLTVNQYKPGEGIGSHTDTISAFGDGLISISLNSGIVMEFRNPKVGPPTKKLVYLPRRSLLLMSGPARFEWEHQIVTRRTDTHKGEVLPRGLRVSLTLRTALDLDGTPLPRVTSTIFPPSFVEIEDGDIADNEVKSSSNALVTPDVEKDHVHRLYDAIATQWHHTRGKRGVLWPGATQFLQNLKPGSLVADVGCGDGKYFPAIWEAGSYVIGTDISRPLLLTALTSSKEDAKLPESRKISERSQSLQHRPAVAVGDCMSIPLRTNSCDAAICIAVMHHLSTLERRIRCIEELVRVVKPGGLINIQAWALEQKNNKNAKRRFASTDVFVPFNAQPKYLDTAVDRGSENIESHATAKTDERTSREQQPQLQGKSAAEIYSKKYRNAEFDDKKGLVVFQRYCHMYRAGELEDVVAMVPGATVVDSGYESGNHFVILEVMTDAAINRENRPT